MPHLLILGANSDIAKACALRFALQGYSLSLASRDLDQLKQFRNFLIKNGVQSFIEVLFFDARDVKSHQTFYDMLSVKPDLLCIAFGYLGKKDRLGESLEEIQMMIDTNFTGFVSIGNIVAKDFIARRKGVVIGISSVAGDRGRKGNCVYGATKSACQHYLSGMRQRLFRNCVHVMDVRPGFIATKMTNHLCPPKILQASAETVAQAIFQGVLKKKNVIYTPRYWFWIMLFVRLIPNVLFKRIRFPFFR